LRYVSWLKRVFLALKQASRKVVGLYKLIKKTRSKFREIVNWRLVMTYFESLNYQSPISSKNKEFILC
jgi:hypothetical protein